MRHAFLIAAVFVASLAPPAVLPAGEVAPAAVSYQLPAEGPLPKTYRVTLAITAADNPDWIVSQFAAGVSRTVTAENGGKFSEVWNGLDDNFMPVPPGEYGVKGIFMPAEIWPPDGQPHTLRAKLHGGPFALTPKPGAGESGPFIEGDPVGQGMGDVDVGPDGNAVFYWQFLENGRNPYPVDLTRPLGPGQLQSGFGSGGTGGGNHVATDGRTVWAVAPDDDLVRTRDGEPAFLYPPFLFRADEKPFGRDDMIRRNVTLTAGRVTGLAAWRPRESGPAWLFVAERGRMVPVAKHPHNGDDLFGESPDERVNVLRVLDGDTAAEIARLPVVEPAALTVGRGRLHLLEKRDGGWTVRHAALPPDGRFDPGAWSVPVPLAGLRDPQDIAVDGSGRYFVADPQLNRVLRFNPAGRLELAFGAADAQREGHYDPEVFMEPTRVACWRDAEGRDRLLVVEAGGPSRITEWSTDGTLLRDWHGLLTHAGNSGFAPDPEDPTDLTMCGHENTLLRYRVDDASGQWELRAVWHGVETGSFPQIIRLRGRKYLAFNRSGESQAKPQIYRFDGDRVLPSAGVVREDGSDGKPGYFRWHDGNGNGLQEPEEYRGTPLQLPGRMTHLRYWGDSWQDDLSLLVPATGTADLYRLPVEDFDAHGNPIFGDWEKVLTDDVYAAKAAGTAPALYGGNEAVSAFNGDWGGARQTPEGEIVVNMRGGGFSANHGWQQKLSRYVPDGRGGFRQKWRVGRSANIVPEPHGVHGSIHVTRPMHGLIGMIDQTRAGVHVYDWDSGLFVDTLMLTTGGRNHEAASVYDSPGEFFSGGAHEMGGKVYLRWGKTSPLLFEIEGWTARHGLRPVTTLPEKIAISAAQIASPPELALQIRGGAGAARVAAFHPLPGAGPALDGSRAGWEGCDPVVFGDDAARIEVRCGYNPETVFLRWEVRAAQPTAVPPLPSPERIFTHDRVATTLGFYLQGDAAAQGKAAAGRPGDIRIVFGLHDDIGQVRPAALGLYPRWDGPGEARPFLYISPGQRTPFAHVALLDAVKLSHTLSDDRKTLVLTAAIPRSVLPATVPDLADGWRTMANFDANIGGSHKLWWSNADGSASRETKDEPTEARLYPGGWGQAAFTPLSGGLPIRAWLVNGPWRAEALTYTGSPENKRQFQEFFDAATFPPDSRAVGSGDIAAQPPAKPGQWRVLNARPIDNCLYPDDGHGLSARGCNLYFAANWIWAPEAMEVALEFPMQHQNNLGVWLNGTRLAETAREQGLYRTVTTPQKITLQSGWNQLFLRGYALGYDLHFGAVVKADVGRLWKLRLSAAPPE